MRLGSRCEKNLDAYWEVLPYIKWGTNDELRGKEQVVLYVQSTWVRYLILGVSFRRLSHVHRRLVRSFLRAPARKGISLAVLVSPGFALFAAKDPGRCL